MSTIRFIILCQVLVMSSQSGRAVIYHLNDSAYQSMPPLFFLDEYDSCLDEEGSIYCMLQLVLNGEPENQLMRMIIEYSDHSIKHYNHSLVDRGICVRKTCQKYVDRSRTSEGLASSLEACLNNSMQSEYGLNARVSTLYYCDHHNEPRKIDGWDWTVLVIIVGLVIINAVGSFYDYFIHKNSQNTKTERNWFLLSFSMIRNWKWLTDTEIYNHKFKELQFIHGSRVISNMCVILAHVMIIFGSGFTSNTNDFLKTFDHPLYLMNYSGMMIVQLFFFISGFLTIYIIRIKEESRVFTSWDIPKIVFLRFSRLVPSLAMTLALATTWVRHVGTGPLWKMSITYSLVADCRNYWWQNLLFVNNYMPNNKYCLIPTWHLAADVQVFLVGLTVYLMTRGRTRRLVLGTLLLISSAAAALHTVLQDLDVVIVMPELYRTLIGDTFRYQHILGHNNLPCFILGMITGSGIHDWLKAGGHLVKRGWYNFQQYLSVAMFVLLLYSGSLFYSDGPRASLLVRAGYSAAIRLLLGFTFAVAASAFFSKTPTLLKSLFEWRVWVVPSRISYSVYLLHIVVIHIVMGSRKQLTHFSGINLISAFVCVVMASYLISVPFYLMVEAPFTMIFKNLTQKISVQADLKTKDRKHE